MKNHKIKITLPHSIDYLPISLNAVSIIAKLSGFDKDEISDLETAVEEVVSNVIRFAYNNQSTFDFIVIVQTNGLSIIIKEEVSPLKPNQEHEYNLELIKAKSDFKEFSSYLLKKLVDKVWLHSLGKKGFETHIFKYFKKYNLHVSSTAESQESEKERIKSFPEKPVTYVVRRMKPKEAIDISRIAYNTYGNTYLHEDIYYPDRVRKLNKKNQLISFIAITENGEVIAHIAYERSTDKSIPEIGVAFTKPSYRGIGCLNKLMLTSMGEAEKLLFTGVFAQAVTSHPYSQKSLNKFGFMDCALLLSIFHELAFKNIEQKIPQRESAMISFHYFKFPEKVTIYPPEHHAEIIASLYKHIGFNPGIILSNITTAPDVDKSVLNVKTNLENLTADITVTTYGKNILTEVHRIMKKLCYHHIVTIYLRIRLTDPFTAKYTADFEKMGFFFSGILPRSAANDELILQYLNNYTIDFDQLKIASDKGKEILEYVKKCSMLTRQ